MSLSYNLHSAKTACGLDYKQRENIEALTQESNRLKGAKWTKRFYLSKQVLDISPVSFIACTSVTKA